MDDDEPLSDLVSDEMATNALTQVATTLRRLATDPGGREVIGWLPTPLRREGILVDVHVFDALADRAERLAADSDPTWAADDQGDGLVLQMAARTLAANRPDDVVVDDWELAIELWLGDEAHDVDPLFWDTAVEPLTLEHLSHEL